MTSPAASSGAPAGLAAALRQIVGPDGVVDAAPGLAVFECDALTLEKGAPSLVVHPRSTAETAAVLRTLHAAGVPFVPRGAGTGLAGGTIALDAPVVVAVTRLRRILAVDLENRRVRVEAGVVNLAVTRAVEAEGFLFAPDPSSQQACTIGGNAATNAGGPHTLKVGVTVDHVLGLRLVLPDGRIVDLGDDASDGPGYDLAGLVVGSEGTFGVVTEVTLRLTRRPAAARTLLGVFDSVDGATRAVGDIIAGGMVPAALEMMDRPILAALNRAFGMGFPEDAAALLLVEVDGLPAGLDRQADRIAELCRARGAREIRRAHDEADRLRLWAARRKAFGAVGRLAPNYLTQDGVVPRSKLPQALEKIREIAGRHRLRSLNVFHAGDGNLHPCLLYDEADRDETARVVAASREILDACLELGGSLTGEHGIGVEKVGLMQRLFSPEDLETMRTVRAVFDPQGRANPGKAIPGRGGACQEVTPRKQASS